MSESAVAAIGTAASDAGPAAGAVETYRGAVYPWHCDHMGHMNVMWYTGKFDEATWQLFGLLGLAPSWLRANARGMAAVEQRTAYQRELSAGDTVVVRSTVLEVREKVLRFVHRMVDVESGAVAATTLLVAAHLDTERRRACAFPPVVAENARRYLGEVDLPWRS